MMENFLDMSDLISIAKKEPKIVKAREHDYKTLVDGFYTTLISLRNITEDFSTALMKDKEVSNDKLEEMRFFNSLNDILLSLREIIRARIITNESESKTEEE